MSNVAKGWGPSQTPRQGSEAGSEDPSRPHPQGRDDRGAGINIGQKAEPTRRLPGDARPQGLIATEINE
jgi:hypothetical protein